MANFLPVFAGRMALNLAWANAIIATWQTTDEGAGLMDQYVTNSDTDHVGGAPADRTRALAVQNEAAAAHWANR